MEQDAGLDGKPTGLPFEVQCQEEHLQQAIRPCGHMLSQEGNLSKLTSFATVAPPAWHSVPQCPDFLLESPFGWFCGSHGRLGGPGSRVESQDWCSRNGRRGATETHRTPRQTGTTLVEGNGVRVSENSDTGRRQLETADEHCTLMHTNRHCHSR